MKKLTKADLTHQLCDEMGLSKSDVELLIASFFEMVISYLSKGDTVKLTRFGNLKLMDKKERPGRNPKTGESVPIKARRVVTFKAGNKLKELIRNNIDQIKAVTETA
ncbi:MAG: integration host factor subunit alpha [Candidatus Comchoanobacterales bacterium]